MSENEQVSNEDMAIIKELSHKKEVARAHAEKHAALSKSAELEYDNAVLALYSKYELRINKDTIKENGEIIRLKPPTPLNAQVEHLSPDVVSEPFQGQGVLE